MRRRIYLASSWRNEQQPSVLAALRAVGHEVYDFRNPAPEQTGFAWSDVDPEWQGWDARSYREKLAHPIAVRGFASDFEAMRWADTGVLLLPSGRSAHIEAGYFTGADKSLYILLAEGQEPELMYRMADGLSLTVEELIVQMEEDRLSQVCRVCGCSEDFGCIGGCEWVTASLCSRCDREE